MHKNKLAIFIVSALLVPTAYAACDPEEVGYVASFEAKAGTEIEFEQALSLLAQTVQTVEQGVILYAPYKGDDGRYFMMERYENETARAAHGKAPEVAALFPTLAPYLATAPDVQPVSAVCR